MSNNKIAQNLGLTKTEDGWIDATGNWKVEKGVVRGYLVTHLPTGKQQACTGVNTLQSAVGIMRDDLLDNRSFFRLPDPRPVSAPKSSMAP